jgi:hypothetical protein
MSSEETVTPSQPTDPRLAKLISVRHSASFLYDLQKFRIATGNRARPDSVRGTEESRPALDQIDQEFLGAMEEQLEELEHKALLHVAKRLKGIDIFDNWLTHQRGVGPTMAAVLLSSFRIEIEECVSQMWSYAGLAVAPDGRAQRRVKGAKAGFNPWLKSKMVKVLADAMIKAYSLDENGEYVVKRKDKILFRATDEGAPFPWRSYYDNRKHYRRSQRVKCMLCDGHGHLGKVAGKVAGMPKGEKTEVCSNCNGEGIGPWGRSDAHRDADCRRYMIKMFLIELHKRWRESLDLPVRPSYHEEKLGHVHGGTKRYGQP